MFSFVLSMKFEGSVARAVYRRVVLVGGRRQTKKTRIGTKMLMQETGIQSRSTISK